MVASPNVGCFLRLHCQTSFMHVLLFFKYNYGCMQNTCKCTCNRLIIGVIVQVLCKGSQEKEDNGKRENKKKKDHVLINN